MGKAIMRQIIGLIVVLLLVGGYILFCELERRTVAGRENALVGCARHGKTEEVVRLLGSGVDPDADSLFGRTTALHEAVKKGHVRTVRLLLERGANTHIIDSKNRTPLALALEQSSIELEILDTLVSNGAEINITCGEPEKPLLFNLLQAEKMVAADWLMSQPGFDIDFANNRGNTALHYSSKLGLVDAVEFLLKHGADANIRNRDGKTPLRLAIAYSCSVSGKRLYIARLLEEAGARALP